MERHLLRMHLEASIVYVGFITIVIYVVSLIKGLEAISNVGLPPNWGLATINRSSFPNDFTFGSASSSFQVIPFHIITPYTLYVC